MVTSQPKEKMFELVTIDPDGLHCCNKHSTCKEFITEKEVIIPKKKPKVEQLAKIITRPVVTSHKTISTPQGKKALFQGKVKGKIFYVACKPEQPVHAAKLNLSFCNFIKLPSKLKVKNITVKVEDIVVQLVDKRKVKMCVLLLTCIKPKKQYKDC